MSRNLEAMAASKSETEGADSINSHNARGPKVPSLSPIRKPIFIKITWQEGGGYQTVMQGLPKGSFRNVSRAEMRKAVGRRILSIRYREALMTQVLKAAELLLRDQIADINKLWFCYATS